MARAAQAAVLLQDGRVLILGGSRDATADLYDPKTGVFSKTEPMNDARAFGVTVNLLSDGRVLVVGGCDTSLDQKPMASAEVYDPATDRFVATGSMVHARCGHTATTLLDGRVLIVGEGSSAEIYNPATGRFVPTGSMVLPRSHQTATLLPDGRVLVAGGTGTGAYNDKAPTSAELYDPKTGRFTLTGSMATPRWSGHTATLLADGRVLVAGGNSSAVDEKPLALAELYDPHTGKFSKTRPMAEARDGQTGTRLTDGQVLVAGGADNTAELYDPRVGVFGSTGSMVLARASHSATLFGNGQVLVAGGAIDPTYGSSAEIYQP